MATRRDEPREFLRQVRCDPRSNPIVDFEQVVHVSQDGDELAGLAPPGPTGAVDRGSATGSRLLAAVRQPLARSAIGSVLTGVFGQAALIVSGVLVARMLTVHDRGVLALVLAIPLILVQLGTLGVPRAVTFEAARPGGSAGSALASATPLAIAQTLGILAICALAAFLLSASRPDFGLVAFLGLAYPPIGVVMQYGLAALQGLGSFRAFNIIRLLPGVSYAVFALIAFVLGGASVAFVIIGWMLTNAIGAAFVLVQVRWELRVERAERQRDATNPPSGSGLLRLGVRSLVGSLSPLGSMGVDQLILGLARSSATLGLYVIASSICNLPRFLAQSFGLVTYPHIAGLPAEKQAGAMLRLVIVAVIAGGIVIVGLELVVGAIIPLFFGAAYAGAVPVARMLLVSAYLFGIGRVLSDSLQGAGRPLGGTVSEVIAVVTLALVLTVLWGSLDAFRFAVAMAFAAGAALLTLAVIAYFRMERSRTPGATT